MDLDTKLNRLRKKKKVTMEEVAEKTDIPLNLYVKYEKGTLYPLRKDLKALADYYEIEVDELLGKKENELDTKELWTRKIIVYSFGASVLLLMIAFSILFSLYYWHETVGLAAVLGTSISAFVLLITFVVLLFIFIKNKRERFLYCLGTVGTNAIILLAVVTINLGSFENYTKYTKENWLNIEEEYRYYVLQDFISQYDMKKMNREEVESYLGEPDVLRPGADEWVYYEYEVGSPVRIHDRKDPYVLYIDFNKGKVTRYTIK